MSTKKSNHLTLVAKSDEPTTSPLHPLAVGPNDAAKLIGIGHSKFWQILARGEIPSIKVNNRRLILVSDLEAWLIKLRDQQAG